MVTTYIHAAHCVKCGVYQKLSYDSTKTGHCDPEPCLACGGKTKCKMVVKGSEHDPKVKNDFVNIAYSENERWSTAMGVPENQVNAFRERYPDSTYSDDGRLLVKNRPDKLRQMRERDFIEHR